MVTLRTARNADERALRKLEAATWSTRSNPGPPPDPERPFLGRYRPDEVIVAVDGDELVGSLEFGPWLPLEAARHVIEVKGLAVDPARQGEGVGGRLLDAGIARARAEGKRRVVLRVLSGNDGALRLYESRGFEVQGAFREAFLLEDRYVDDLNMALDLTR